MSYACIVVTSREWFDKTLNQGARVYHFPPNKNPRVNKLSSGSICVIYLKGERVFVGEFQVEEIANVDANEFNSKYRSMAIEVEDAPFPRGSERCWVIKFRNMVKYPRSVKQEECKDIRTSTSKKPLSEWVLLGFTLIKLEDAEIFINAIRSKADLKIPIKVPERVPEIIVEAEEISHDELIKYIKELGEMLNFVISVDEPTPDNLYKLDVTWRDAEGHRPIKVFEVVVKSRVDEALARLLHAYDIWGSEQLWLIVRDEKNTERARRLLEPRLKGSFAKIKNRVHIIGWNEIYDLYHKVKDYGMLLKELSKR